MRLYCLLLILLIALPVFAGEARTPNSPPKPGASLAGMRVYDLDGRRHNLDEVKTRRVVVIFWAFWCDTWKKALPSVRELAAMGDELDCTVWTVSVDGACTSEIRPLVKAGRITFPVLLDDGAWQKKLSLRRVPTVMVLDEQRKVIWLRELYPGNVKIEQAVRGTSGS